MKKTILAAVPLAMLALASPAAAHGSKHATTLKAKFAPSADSTVRGAASLVDGKRRDRFRLRVKGLAAGATYTWTLRQAAGDGDACTGETVASFSYSSLQGRRKAAKVRSRAKDFSAATGASYAVVIVDETGEDVACAELLTKAQRKAAKRKAAGQEQTGGDDVQTGGDDVQTGGDDEQQGDDDEQGDDQQSGDAAEDESGDDDGEDLGDDSEGDGSPEGSLEG